MMNKQQAETLEETGRKLAVSQSWDGYNILVIAQAALTDANFHHEAEIIGQMIDGLDQLADPRFELTVIDGDALGREDIP